MAYRATAFRTANYKNYPTRNRQKKMKNKNKKFKPKKDLNVDGDTIVPYWYGTYLWTPEHRRLIALIFVYI